MTDKPIKILLIDNNHEDVLKIRETLDTSQTDQFECIHIDRLSEGLESLVNHVFDIIMLDLSLPGGNGFDTFIDIHQASPDIPVITMSRIKDDDLATRALQEGADDHIFKGDIDGDSLKRSILNAMNRKQTKNHLLRIPDAWERTFDAISDLIMILDSEHQIIRANKAMAERVGLAREELIGRSCYHAVHGTEEPPHFCPHARLLADGLDHSVEVHEDHLGGNFLVSVTPLYGTDGTLIGSVHIARDITESKRREEALSKSEQEFRLAFENAKDAIFWADSGTGLIINCNTAAENLLERRKEDIIGFHQKELHPPQKAEYYTDMFKKHITMGTAFDEEAEVITGSGKIKPVHITASIMSVAGKSIIQGIFRNITDRVHMEEQLRYELSVNISLSKLYTPLVSPYSSIEEITHIVLEESKYLTKSSHGYVSSIDPTTGDNIVHTLTEMLRNECRVSEENQKIVFPRGHDGRYHGLWGHSLNTREAFFANMPESHPASSGIPSGHIPIKRFLSVPVFLDDELVGQIALANADHDYTDRDLDTVSRLGNFYALALHRKRVEEELLDKTHELRERVKELNCLFEISKIREDTGDSLEKMLQNIVDIIPSAYQYPEIMCSRITMEDQEFRTNNFRETIWKQGGDIIVHGKKAGSLEVYYTEMKPEEDDGPFLKEERQLLKAICERLGRFIEHRGAVEALKKAHDELEMRVQERTASLEAEYTFRKTIEDSIISGIVAVDLEGRHAYVNRAFCKMVGWNEDELIGAKPPFVYWPSEEMEKIKEAFHAILHGKIPPGGFELLLQRKNGERFYALILVSPLRDNQGNVAGWVASVGDITARKKAGEALRKSEAGLAEAQRIAHLGNWDWNIETNELRWSDEIYRIFGLTPQEFGATYDAFLDSVHPEDREFVKKAVNEALYGMPYNIEHRIVLPDSSIRTVHEQGEVTYGESGEAVRMVGTVQDITEKKGTETRLIMSERLSALGQMASGIAHEINNPLATISACADGLLNRMKKGKSDPGVLENYLNIINEEVMRCKNITTNMLSLVRETTYEKKDVDINEVLDKTLELIGFQGRLKNVDVITNYQGTPVIHGSEGELKQVFLSIIMNALDAMDDKGTLTLETGMEDRETFINIKDTGHGISSEDMSRIFDPFFTTKIEKGGIGLGLSIANKIIVENYGKILVVSEQGNGTTFSIKLPIVQSGNMSPH